MEFGFSEREELLRKSVRELAEAEITEGLIEKMEETGSSPWKSSNRWPRWASPG